MAGRIAFEYGQQILTGGCTEVRIIFMRHVCHIPKDRFRHFTGAEF